MAKPRTAKNGKADWSLDGVAWTEIPEVRNVEWNPSTEPKEYASSSTLGKKRRLEGNDDFDGSIEVYIDPDIRFDAAAFGIRNGVTGYFRVYEERTDTPFILPVFIEDVEYGIPIEDGDIIGASINFSGDGDVTYPE